MTDKQLKKEIFKLRKQLRQDIKEVRLLAKTNSLIPTTAIKKMSALEKTMRDTAVSNMTPKQLRNLYRDLRYVRDLKSSTPHGAETTAQRFSPLEAKLKSLSPRTRRAFWEVYSKLYEETNGQIEQFKYALFESDLIDNISSGQSSKLAIKIEDMFNELFKELPKSADESEYEELFLQKLSSIFK